MSRMFILRAPPGISFWPLYAVIAMISSRVLGFGVVHASDLSSWSDEELFESAVAARDNGDCVWALELFRELLQRATDTPLAPRALYGQALCYEDRGLWEAAAGNYEQIIARFPTASTAPDAWFRQGMLLERQSRFREAERCYRHILKQYKDLEDADRRAVETQLAWEQLLQGRIRRAVKHLDRLEKAWEELAPGDLRVERFYVAKAHIALGAVLSDHASRITFQAPRPGRGLARYLFLGATGRHQKWLADRLQEREERVRAATFHYGIARRQKTPIWISAAFFLNGSDHVGHYLALNHAPIPRGLTEDQAALYREMLAEKTRVYLVSASQLFLQGHEAAVANGDTSRWAELLTAKVRLVEREGVEGLADDPRSSGAFWLWSDMLVGSRRPSEVSAEVSHRDPVPALATLASIERP